MFPGANVLYLDFLLFKTVLNWSLRKFLLVWPGSKLVCLADFLPKPSFSAGLILVFLVRHDISWVLPNYFLKNSLSLICLWNFFYQVSTYSLAKEGGWGTVSIGFVFSSFPSSSSPPFDNPLGSKSLLCVLALSVLISGRLINWSFASLFKV